VQVEVSFREAVVGEPVTAFIGGPYCHPFDVLVMQPAQMVAEKLRALAQRIRATNLADLAALLSTEQLEDHAIAQYGGGEISSRETWQAQSLGSCREKHCRAC